MPTRTLVLCLAVAILAWGGPALAHVAVEVAPAPAAPIPSLPAAMPSLDAAAPGTTGLWAVLVAAALAAVAIARRRRAVALASVAVLMLIAFESGLHSVHHISDQGEASCVVASASAQTGALTVERIAAERPLEVATAAVVHRATPTPARSAAPDLGRAPPAV